MNKSNRLIFVIALLLIGGTAFGMTFLRTNQKLGKPGVKATDIPGSPRMNVYLPPYVLDYESRELPTDTNLLNGLPQDTSFAARHYTEPDQSWLQMRIVMMGTDRTSIHRPQLCLKGSGWDIDDNVSSADTIRVQEPHPYDLPVMKLVASQEYKGQTARAIYVYWFVADNDLTAQHGDRMWKSATHLLRTGELERWSYVSCYKVCAPGQEEAAYAKIKQFISASVPKFQLASNARVENREPSKATTR